MEAHRGAILFWLGVALAITLVLLAPRAADRRARRTGLWREVCDKCGTRMELEGRGYGFER